MQQEQDGEPLGSARHVLYFTLLYFPLYVLVQHARELQTTDGDMYLNTLSPGSPNNLTRLHSRAFRACKTCGVA
jgi:hypothetical protein